MDKLMLTLLKFFFGSDLAASKKFRTFIVGVLTTALTPVLCGKLGMDPGTLEQVTNWVAGLAAALLAGQGMTDFGKEAAKDPLPLPPPPVDATGIPGEPKVG